MIDENRLVEEIEKRANPNNPKDVCYVANIKRIIKDQPKTGEWIDCKREMPSPGVYVLVFTKDKDITIGKYWWPKEWYIYERWVSLHYVIAWMPLPEPYEVKDDE